MSDQNQNSQPSRLKQVADSFKKKMGGTDDDADEAVEPAPAPTPDTGNMSLSDIITNRLKNIVNRNNNNNNSNNQDN